MVIAWRLMCAPSKYCLHRFPQCIGAFGAAFDGRLARARIASGNGFFPAFAQATLESIPAATDSNRAVADYD